MATVLLISEHAVSIETVRTTLINAGHDVLLASVDVEVLEATRGRHFDLALVDQNGTVTANG